MNILIVSHEGFASGLKKAAEMIAGHLPVITTIELTEAGVEEYSKKVKDYLGECTEECLILADLFGGTPANQAILQTKLLEKENQVKIVANVTLGLLLEVSFLNTLAEFKGVLPRTQSLEISFDTAASEEDE